MESFNRFPKIADEMHKAISKVVRKAAYDIAATAMKNAPVDTGFLRNSIYVVTHDESTYGEELTRRTTPSSKPTKSGKPRKLSKRAQAIKAHMETDLLPEVDKPDNDTTAYVAVGASYGIYLEMGTRYQPAQPYLAPAIEAVRPKFEAALGKIDEHLKGSIT